MTWTIEYSRDADRFIQVEGIHGEVTKQIQGFLKKLMGESVNIDNELPRSKLRGIRAMSNSVTPAQAGVQKAPQDWIPASAGMTKPQQVAGN
jgi:hypothetical protein